MILRSLARRAIEPLKKNVTTSEFMGDGLHGAFQIPNFRRTSFLSYFWVQNFVNRQHVFNVHHTGYIMLVAFFYWSGMLDTAPLERREKHYMNGSKFRLQTAYANEGTRPAATIAREQAKLRYFYAGNDHPWTVNEKKDLYFKLRENHLIQEYPGIQYPYVYRNMTPATTDSPLKVDCYPEIQKAPHFHEDHGHGH